MDPNCAVCDRPAEVECNCEAKQLESVIRVAQKTMMSAVLSNIRYVFLGIFVVFPHTPYFI